MNLFLLSGGLDSTVMLGAFATPGSRALFVDYGQRSVRAELAAARSAAVAFGVPLEILSCDMVGGLVAADAALSDAVACVVPCRNIVLLSLAAGRVSSGSVYIGCCAEDQAAFPDCRQQTLTALGRVFTEADIGAAIVAPFVDTAKADIIRLAQSRGFLSAALGSVSCYRGAPPCRECHACAARAVAMRSAGVS